jgi:SAM-dependent methyltransferase
VILLQMKFDQPFDAIVGRFVLMYQEDPVASLRKITKHLRPGGLVVFQELDSSACRSFPTVPAFDEAAQWLMEALRGSGARPNLGLEMTIVICPSVSELAGVYFYLCQRALELDSGYADALTVMGMAYAESGGS